MSYDRIAEMEKFYNEFSQMAGRWFPEPKPQVSTNYTMLMDNSTFGIPPSDNEKQSIKTSTNLNIFGIPNYKNSQTLIRRVNTNSGVIKTSYLHMPM